MGWIKVLKVISDIFCVLEGKFFGINPVLKEKIAVINQGPYGAGWIYEAQGKPDARCVDVQAYKTFLDQTIDRILEKQKADENQ